MLLPRPAHYCLSRPPRTRPTGSTRPSMTSPGITFFAHARRPDGEFDADELGGGLAPFRRDDKRKPTLTPMTWT